VRCGDSAKKNAELRKQPSTSRRHSFWMHRILRIHCRETLYSSIRPLFHVPRCSRLTLQGRFIHTSRFTCQKTAVQTTGRFSFRQIPHSRFLLAISAAASIPLISRGSDTSDDTTVADDLTLEQSLLKTSDDERRTQTYGVNKDRSIFYRFFVSIEVGIIKYIYEPIATGLRFIQLIFIFVPVFATIPFIFIGLRDPKRDNDRSGCLWWYGFLVRQMERAGPTFIKVVLLVRTNEVGTMGCVEDGYISG
jgi:hypothetical protein